MASDTKPCAEAQDAAVGVSSYLLKFLIGGVSSHDLHEVAAIIQSAIDARLAEERREVEELLRDFAAAARSWHECHHTSAGIQCDLFCDLMPRAESLLSRWRKTEVENGK